MSYLVKRGRMWWIETDTDGGIGLETGPFFTYAGARLHMWIWYRDMDS